LRKNTKIRGKNRLLPKLQFSVSSRVPVFYDSIADQQQVKITWEFAIIGWI